MSQSDAALVKQLVAGEKHALDSLMATYQEPVYFFILRYLHDEDLAYDMVQETFLRVYTRASSYNPKYRFSTWLYQIALNLCRDHGRKQALRRFFSLSDGDSPATVRPEVLHDAQIEARFDTDADVRELQRQISLLPHKLKSALILYALEENSQAACSEILGVSRKTVETRVYRAKKLLEQKMADRFKG